MTVAVDQPIDPAAGFAGRLHHWRKRRRWSQEELSLRAGTTQRHLSFLERGRSHPGRGLVLRLAESLELGLRERNELLLAAGYAPAFAESRLDEPALAPVRAALERIAEGHLPYPAVVVRPHGELVLANSAADILFEGVAEHLLRPPVNVLRIALHPEGLAPRVGNLATWGRHITESLRSRAGRSPDPQLSTLLSELESYLPPLDGSEEGLGFSVPLQLASADGELRLITTLTSFATATDVTLAELHLEAFLPDDDATAAVLQLRHRRQAPGGT